MGKEKKQPLPKQNTSDINEIFKAIKKPEAKKPQKEEPKPEGRKQSKQKLQKKQTQPQQYQNKFTEEGYKIYNADELKIGKGGNTNLCPFDCDCCF